MVNYISHNQPMFIKFSDRHLAVAEKEAEQVSSEKRFALSSSGMGDSASTLGSEADHSPRSEGVGAQISTSFSSYADDNVDVLRARLNDKARSIEAEGDKIEAISA